jgi:radical SAM protein with 4Fe4S-binding SPASM domain
MLDLEITTRCNQNCRYCFVRALRPETDLDLATIEAVLQEGFAAGMTTVHLTGGEPLLHPCFETILDRAADVGFKQAIINTNGTLLDRFQAQRLAAHRLAVHLSISVDGPQKRHEKNRGRHTHAKALRGVEQGLAAGLPVAVFTVVSHDFVSALDSFCHQLWTAYPTLSGMALIPLGTLVAKHRNAAQTTEHGLSAADVIEVGLISAAHLLCGRSVTVLDFPLVNLVYKALGLPVQKIGSHCTACRKRICVQADRTITPCHPCWIALDTYTPGVFSKLPQNELVQKLAARRFDGCRNCAEREICGHCRAAVLASGQPILGNDFFCVDLRRALRQRQAKLVTELKRRVMEAERHYGQLHNAELHNTHRADGQLHHPEPRNAPPITPRRKTERNAHVGI